MNRRAVIKCVRPYASGGDPTPMDCRVLAIDGVEAYCEVMQSSNNVEIADVSRAVEKGDVIRVPLDAVRFVEHL